MIKVNCECASPQQDMTFCSLICKEQTGAFSHFDNSFIYIIQCATSLQATSSLVTVNLLQSDNGYFDEDCDAGF